MIRSGSWSIVALLVGVGPVGLPAACRTERLPEEFVRSDAPGEGSPGAGAASGPQARPARVPSAAEAGESLACAGTIARLSAETELPGAPVNAGFERALLLGRARAEPVVFLRAPRFDAQTGTPEARALRAALLSADRPAFAFETVLAKVKKNPELAREVFLSEGYLYSDSPALAALFVNYLSLGLLFREAELRLLRGRDVWLLRRHAGDYEYQSGPLAGQRATLLLFDRVSVAGSALGPALHLDVRALSAQSLSDEVRIERLTESGAVAALRFGQDWLPAALRRKGAGLELDCWRIPAALRDRVEQTRAWAQRRERVAAVLARVVQTEVDEGLPFDEPKTEDGQQDGQLRPAWRRAYLEGRDSYTFNDDKYSVFDNRGRPHTPQVCIDFITDTLERASGGGFRARGEQPAYVRGRLDFDAFSLDNRRSVETFVGFARSHPEWFELTQTEPEARVPFRERTAFFRDIYARRDEYRPFDIVTIFGLRSDGKLHYHSFFVADRDPVTGAPIAVVANAGRPRIRSWENELQNAPARAIFAHIRPKLPWLEQSLAPEPARNAQQVPGQIGGAG